MTERSEAAMKIETEEKRRRAVNNLLCVLILIKNGVRELVFIEEEFDGF